jgi:hypothetical protein
MSLLFNITFAAIRGWVADFLMWLRYMLLSHRELSDTVLYVTGGHGDGCVQLPVKINASKTNKWTVTDYL